MSKISIAGLAALLVGVLAVFMHGLARLLSTEQKEEDEATTQLTLFPSSWSDFSAFFGITVYCFGVVPLIFSIQVRTGSLAFLFCFHRRGWRAAWLTRCGSCLANRAA